MIYETLEWQHPYVPLYRIGFGGNPVHPIIMAHVLGQISTEISMYPGVVSICVVDKLMKKKWRSHERGELLEI